MVFAVAALLGFFQSVCRAVLAQPPLTSQGFNSNWHFAVVTQGSLFYTQGFLAVCCGYKRLQGGLRAAGRIEKWDTLFVHETLCDIT